jgi:phosphatidylcholine synthase
VSDAPFGRKVLGWLVHIYTGCGLLLAVWIVSLLLQTERTPDDYRLCFLLMLVATVIDATDGSLARAVRIKETIPSFDGRRLDDLVDFVMYTCLPLLLIDRAGIIPEAWRWVLVVALGASTYGFCQSDVKSPDGAFQGFPSYWNIVAFYFYTLPLTNEIAIAIVLGFSLLTFVPSYYPYPSQPGRVNRIMLALSVPWTILVLICVLLPWDIRLSRELAWVSFAYPVLYLAVSWGMSAVRAARKEKQIGA